MTTPESIAIASVNGLKVDPSSNTPSVARLNICVRRALPRRVRVEARQRGHRQDFAGVDVHDDAGRADRREMVHGVDQLVLQRLLDPAGDRQRPAARRGWRDRTDIVERALDAGAAMAVDVGEAEDVSGKRGLRVEPVGLALDRQARLAERVDRLDQLGRGAAAQVEERLVRAEQREILLFASAPASAARACGQARACRR